MWGKTVVRFSQESQTRRAHYLPVGTHARENLLTWLYSVLLSHCFCHLFCAICCREACKACTATQRVTLAMALAKVVGQCAAFLGTACVTTCVAALLCGVAEDTTVVRAAAQRAWDDLQSALQTSKYLPRDAYLRLNDGLSQRYLDSVRGASAAALIGNEGKLKDHLHILLGLGFGLRDHIQSLVRIADHSRVLVRMVRDLLAPDPGVCGLRITASVLETRCYTYQTSVLQSGTRLGSVDDCYLCAEG